MSTKPYPSSPVPLFEHPVHVSKSLPLIGPAGRKPISALDLRAANKSLEVFKSSSNYLPTPTSHLRTVESLTAAPLTPIRPPNDPCTRTRSESKSRTVRSNSRRRKKSSWVQDTLFYGLVVLSELLLMAIPVTVVILVQAYSAQQTVVPQLVAFVLVLFFAFLCAVPTLLLYWKYQKRLIRWGEKMEQEVDRYRNVIREKDREIKHLKAFTSRLRRSLSRGSRRREASIAAARASERAETNATGASRSVSRGRTGRSHTLEEVLSQGYLELEGDPDTNLEIVTVEQVCQKAILQIHRFTDSLNKPLPPDPPMHSPRRSSLQRWADTLTLTGSPPQGDFGGRILETELLQSPEMLTDEAESPPYQVTTLDRYTAPETLRQGLERSVQNGRTGMLPAMEAEIRGLKLQNRQDDTGIRPWSSNTHRLDLDSDSDSDELNDVDDAEIVRGGNGGYGSEQSDDNFERSHQLEDDAESMSDSLKEKRKAASIRTVIEWNQRATAENLLAGTDEEIAGDDGSMQGAEHVPTNDKEAIGKGYAGRALKNSWSVEDVGRGSSRRKNTSDSEEARRNFNEWHARRLRIGHKRSRSETVESDEQRWIL
ncbi:hypothetical protein MMC13_005856 [Lambiella insularis]|nr:hypothetical protein [Lambiella insularis]